MANQSNPQKAFLGIGLAFPVCLEADGTLSLAVYEDDIRQSIRIILGTNPGERVMRPDFGAGLNAFLFEPISFTTMQRVKQRVQEALIDWEPRIEVEKVTVSNDRSEPGKLLIDIEYRIRATNTRANLVYPFYLQEGSSR